jgi:hypothetical protein
LTIHWTLAKDEIVRTHAGVLPAAEIAILVGCGADALRHRSQRLGTSLAQGKIDIVVGDIKGSWWVTAPAAATPCGELRWNCVCLYCSAPRIIGTDAFRPPPRCRVCQHGNQSPEESLLLFARGERMCSTCRRIQPLTEFSPSKSAVTGFHSICRTCMRVAHLLRHHQMSLVDYAALSKLQDDVCGRCGEPPEKVGTLCVDHDHTVCSDHPEGFSCPTCRRGLLCDACNLFVASREKYGVTSDPLTQIYLARYVRQ